MSDPPAGGKGPQPISLEGLIDSACDRFEAAWKSGRRPEIEEYLELGASGEGSAARGALSVELVKVDLDYRWRTSRADSDETAPSAFGEEASGSETPPLPERPLLEHYVRRLDELGPLEQLPKSLIAHEYAVRHQWGDCPGHEEYLSRFQSHEPGLRDLLAQVDGRLRGEGTEAFFDAGASTSRGRTSEPLRVRCPHCHESMEVGDDASLAHIRCTACGSDFGLVGDGAADPTPASGGTAEGRRTIGQFELVDCLGAGAFGTVWKAHDRQLDRTVAVKIPRKGELTREETEKFLREARAAAQLQHPNVVSVHEVGLEDERIYIVSDFVEGLPLDEWLVDQRPTLRQSAELCAKIADALEHAHQHGVVHRDLKPSNIMIDGSGDPHLMDFGLAKREAGEVTMTLEGQILGTPAYMSPEQARGESHEADQRTDVYSLGVILFELLTGERPFRGNVRMLLKQIVEDEPPSPRRLDGRVPRDLETISLKCLEKEPARRYRTAREVGDELRRYLQGEAIRARPISRPARLWRWCRRNPVVAGLSVTAVSLLVAVAAVATWGYVNTSKALTDRSEALQREADQREIAESKEAEALREKQRAQNMAAKLLVEQVDLLRRDRPLGWTWKGRDNLSEALKLGIENPDWVQLRTLAAGCLGGTDLREVGQFANNQASFCVAFSPNGEQLAVAQYKAQAYAICTVSLFRLSDGSARHFSFLPSWTWQLQAKVQDGGRALAFSPNGTWLVAGTRSGWAHRWNLSQEQPKAVSWQAHQAEIYDLVFSPDGKSLYSASKDQTVARWDVDANWTEAVRRKGSRSTCCALSRDGSRLAISDSALHWHDPATLERVSDNLQGSGGDMLRYCGRARLLALGSGGELLLFDEKNQLQLAALTQPQLKIAHQAPITAIDVSPDGALIASGDSKGRLKLWDSTSRRLLTDARVASGDPVRPVFSPDGSHLAATANRRIVLFELNGGAIQSRIAVQECEVRAFALAPDGQVLATVAAHPDGLGVIRFWDFETGKLQGEWEVDAGFSPRAETTMSFSPAGDLLVVGGGEERMHLLRPAAEEVENRFEEGTARTFVCGLDGRTIWGVRDDSDVVAWDRETMEVELCFSNRITRAITGQATIHALAVGKEWVLAGTASAGAVLIRANDAEPEAFWNSPGGPISAVALSHDESLAAVGTRGGAIRIVRVPSGRTLADLNARQDQILSLAFSADAALLATASRDSTIRLWKVAGQTVEELFALDFHAGPVAAVAFDREGKHLIVLVRGESALRLWRLDQLHGRLAAMGLGWHP